MITYKGSTLLRGKNFLTESNSKIMYVGKVYKDLHLFKENDMDLVLTEDEVSKLKPFVILKEHSLLEEQDNQEDLYQMVATYTDKQINILENTPSNKLWTELKDSFQEEVNKLSEEGFSYKTGVNKFEGGSQYLIETLLDYLKETQRNISDTSLPNHFTQLNNFIYNIDQLGSEK